MTTEGTINNSVYPDQPHELSRAVNEYTLWRGIWNLRIGSDDIGKHRRFIRDKLTTSLDKICDILDTMHPVKENNSEDSGL